MKNLLVSTAIVASMGFATGAFAQDADPTTADPTNSLAGQQESLLQSLLSDAASIQSTLANTSENLADIDGSIKIDIARWKDTIDVTAGDGVFIMEPINAKIGQLSTTVIGSLGSGTVVADTVLSNVNTINQAITSTSRALNTSFADDNAGLQQVYNLSSNLGALDASVVVNLAGVNLEDLAGISTTAIGSLGTGSITADLVNNAAGLEQRLIGTN